MTVGWIDWTIIIVYMLGIVALGCWAGLRRKEAKGSDYFLAGKSLRWPLIGMALFATNISTIHLVMLAQSGYCSGLLYGNFEWMAGFTLVILSLFFAPFYIRAGVATLPDFIEKRYSRSCRDIMAVLCIFSAVIVHIGFSLYAGAVVLEGTLLTFLDNPEQYRLWTIIAICGATALYTIIGGLMAVVLTESIQTIVLIAGAVCITLLGLYKMGHWDGTPAGLSDPGQMIDGWRNLKATVHPNNFSMGRPDSDPTGLSWYAVFAGYWITGIWYWCTDQTIVQRVLGAKDENHARIGPLFAAFIKILPVFIFVLPGLICLGMIQNGIIDPLPLNEDGTPNTGQTYSHLIQNVLPVGAKGLVIAALLAALMSTVSGALNSIATLFSYDIYKRWAPEADDKHLIRVGRIATFVAMIVAVVWSLGVGLFGKTTIFQAMVNVFCAVAPPTTVVFVWGVFWRRTSAKAALITLIVGSLVGAGVTALTMMGLNYIGDLEINSLLSCFLLAVFESVLIFVCSMIWPHKHTEESEKLVWKSPLDALRGEHGRGLNDFRVWTVAVLVAMIGLYWYWWGGEPYHPVQGTVTLADKTPVVGAAVIFDCDDDALDFERVTNHKGQYSYASKQEAGGAPEGTEYKVRIVPRMDMIVRLNADDPKKDEVLYKVPAGTEIKEEEVADEEVSGAGKTKKVYTFLLEGRKEPIQVPRGEGIKIFRATVTPAKYESFDGAKLDVTVNKVPIFTKERSEYYKGYSFKLK
ncbi:MAG: sodium/solute symporter [Candidatus Nealsonbacteria bacterium]|nr:sodium/solute symporter [Candidatus Nealsonbacteria bacterium]